MKNITLQSIGMVENEIEIGRKVNWREYYFLNIGRKVNWQDLESNIIVDDKFRQGLDGIEEYSHIVLIFWANKVKYDKSFLKIYVPYAPKGIKKKGVFSTRVPTRPNPIGVSTVQLISRNKNILRVRGLDVFNKTPILDIKPYTGHPRDIISNFKVPKWEQR